MRGVNISPLSLLLSLYSCSSPSSPGVGEADFEAMSILDGDGQRLRAGAEVASRDIVQVYPLKLSLKFPADTTPVCLARWLSS